MDPFLIEAAAWAWAETLARWIHVITGVAWIGASFYFVHLDLSLRPPRDEEAGVGGEAWQVHGGGFYRMRKYLVAPPDLPEHLTWFKWEAYSTWMSGVALLALVYWVGADLHLIDAREMALTRGQAIGLSVAALAGGWLVYDGLCRSALGRDDRRLGAALYLFIVAMAFGLAEVFSGRGAFIHLGALMGGAMVGNVFFVIIPNQKKVVAALLAGETPDPELGRAAKQRSLHNNYLTLPVLFLMIAIHYPLAYGTAFAPAIAALIVPVGAVMRHFFNSRHAGRGSPWWAWGVAAAGFAAIAGLSLAGPRHDEIGAAGTAPAFAEVEEIVLSRCSMCHAREPVWEGLAHAPGGLFLEEASDIARARAPIAMAAAWSDAMPPGNVTAMTAQERAALAAWAGAPLP